MTKPSKARFATAALLAISCASASAAQDYSYLDLYIVNHEDLAPDDDGINGGIRGGLGFTFAGGASARSSLEVGMFGNGIERLANSKGVQLGLMLDVVQAFDLGAVAPFLAAGVGVVQEKDRVGRTDLFPAIEASLGAQFATAGGGSVRLSVAAQDVFNDGLTNAQDSFIDYRFNLGFVMPVAAAPAAPAPRPPADTDGDGVPDGQDACPAQPAATADGCPAAPIVPAAPAKDTDGDGIEDTKDECPGTLEGLQVDGSGCVTTAAQKIVLKGVTFLPNSTDLTPDAKKVLDEAYDALAGQTSLRVEVGGHTDSMGDDKLNQALSQRRAESVRKYLTGKGIAADRLEAKGYGESQPIADNKTKAGRQENRRVELKILN